MWTVKTSGRPHGTPSGSGGPEPFFSPDIISDKVSAKFRWYDYDLPTRNLVIQLCCVLTIHYRLIDLIVNVYPVAGARMVQQQNCKSGDPFSCFYLDHLPCFII